MTTALDVARYFVERASSEDSENDLSPLKLQKLCYYAQGFCLAILGRPLFGDAVEAWDQGPVVDTIYQAYKSNGAQPIRKAHGGSPIADSRELELLEAVYSYYGQFSAWALRNRTHIEPPWKEAYPTKSDLKKETMAAFFRTQLVLLDNSVESEKDAVRRVLEANTALAEGTKRGRADVAAGRVHKLRR